MKYDVEEYLKKRKLKRESLHEDIAPMLSVYDRALKLYNDSDNNGELLKNVNKFGKDVIDEIKAHHPETKEKEAPQKKVATKSNKGQETKDKTPAVKDELAECKRLIKVARQKKIASGEIKAPVKQSSYTKIKNSLLRVLKSVPGDSVSAINSTKEALIESAKKIFNIHGWKRWKIIEDALKEAANQRIKKLEKSRTK